MQIRFYVYASRIRILFWPPRHSPSAMPKKLWYPLAKKASITSIITCKSEGALLGFPPFNSFPLAAAVAKQRSAKSNAMIVVFVASTRFENMDLAASGSPTKVSNPHSKVCSITDAYNKCQLWASLFRCQTFHWHLFSRLPSVLPFLASVNRI